MPVRLPAARESISTVGSQKRRRKWRRRAGGFLPFLREDDEAEEEEALVGRGSFEDIKILLNQGRRARGGDRLNRVSSDGETPQVVSRIIAQTAIIYTLARGGDRLRQGP